MSNAGGSLTPAGWYADPSTAGQLRWWNGVAWTEHVLPAPPPAPQPTPAYEPVLDESGRPYVPFQNSGTAAAALGYERTGPTQWNTVSSWIIATSSLWMIVGELLILLINGSLTTATPLVGLFGGYLQYLVFIALWAVLLIAAITDHGALRRWGYRTVSSPAWILLGPLIYIIVRTVRVHAEVRRGIAPLIFLIVSGVVIGIASAVAIPVYLFEQGGGSDVANASSLASGIRSGLEKNGGDYSVTCSPFNEPTTAPVDITCKADDATSGVDHRMFIEIDPSTTVGGEPTFRLLSVDPPIAQ